MPNGYGQGRSFGRPSGGGHGFAFRGSSPPWPYVGRGRGGLPRCSYYLRSPGAAAPGFPPAPSGMTREDEIKYMKDQAKVVKGQLDEIESRIRDLEAKK